LIDGVQSEVGAGGFYVLFFDVLTMWCVMDCYCGGAHTTSGGIRQKGSQFQTVNALINRVSTTICIGCN
jgi:hypothetical protein